ncbi:MAG: ETEC_3214 domain-containing protein [Nitrospirota bacterium]
MTHLPTIEEIEEKILKIFSDFNIRPTESLPYRNILHSWFNTGYKNSELADGLESLIKKSYLENTGNGSFRLTEKVNELSSKKDTTRIETSAVNIINIQHMEGSQIQQGGSGGSQSGTFASKKGDDFSADHNPAKNRWHEKPIGYVFLTVIAALIAGYLVYYFGWNAPKETKPQILQEHKVSAKHATSIPGLEIKEYIFGNQYFYLQVLTDKSGRVLAYGVTTRKADFNPSFKILEHAFTADTSTPEDFSKAIPLAFNIILGKTHFSDFPHSPENISANHGARRFHYYEEYYFGNPGNYQSYYFGINDSGYVDIDEDNVNILFKDEIDPNDKSVEAFRKRSTINTFFVTSPMRRDEPALKEHLIGPDYDQVRVIPDAAVTTKETQRALLSKMKRLSTEVNIQLYVRLFGQPLIINDRSY